MNRVGELTVSYCINPKCPNFNVWSNINEASCSHCKLEKLLQGRYRVVQPLSRGGFGQTYEIVDLQGASDQESGTPKVLKVLLTNHPRAIALFQREARVLSQLNHPGIPQVAADGYFTLLENSQEPLHCLVMEKVAGITLKDWLSNPSNLPLTQAQAIAWLKQLAEILAKIHQQQYIHRDIKPSNIMLRPNGQLVLIDFGAVREITETYLRIVEGRDVTKIISVGYTPAEQYYGRAKPQSDFFALGRTYVYLLTGIHPLDLAEDSPTDELAWRNSAPQISSEFADLIDELMLPICTNRPENADVVLQRLEEIENLNNSAACPQETGSGYSGDSTIELIWRLDKKRLAVAVSFMLLLGSGVAIINPFKAKSCNSQVRDFLSCGEEVLLPELASRKKLLGAKEFASGKYAKAVNLLQQERNQQPNDPETLIYLNNAQLANKKAYTIAVAVPLSTNRATALEILQGVAQAQEEVNHQTLDPIVKLRVLIADDANEPTQAQKIADSLAQRDVLAVIGHYASDVTVEVIEVYQKNQLVLISSSSTAENISKKSSRSEHMFFRTVSSTRVEALALANYLVNQAKQRKAAVFYSPQSYYSQSLWKELQMSLPVSGGQIVAAFDLSKPEFTAKAAIAQAEAKGATALVLLPDGKVSPHAFRNTLQVMQANQNRYLMVGSNPLQNPEILGIGEYAVNHLVVNVPWHPLSSSNPTFPVAAKRLWGQEISGRAALAYDATRTLITALEKLSSPSRINLQQTLADPNFRATGATGVISFEANGDRTEPVSTLVKVVRTACLPKQYVFVPITQSEPLNCNLAPHSLVQNQKN